MRSHLQRCTEDNYGSVGRIEGLLGENRTVLVSVKLASGGYTVRDWRWKFLKCLFSFSSDFNTHPHCLNSLPIELMMGMQSRFLSWKITQFHCHTRFLKLLFLEVSSGIFFFSLMIFGRMLWNLGSYNERWLVANETSFPLQSCLGDRRFLKTISADYGKTLRGAATLNHLWQNVLLESGIA